MILVVFFNEINRSSSPVQARINVSYDFLLIDVKSSTDSPDLVT
jgi:hypothetical protein